MFEDLSDCDVVVLKDGACVSIDTVIKPGKRWRFFDERLPKGPDGIPPYGEFGVEDVDHVVMRDKAPFYLGTDGWVYRFGVDASEGRAWEPEHGERSTVNAMALRSVLSSSSVLKEINDQKAAELIYGYTHPSYDPAEVARDFVDYLDRRNIPLKDAKKDWRMANPSVRAEVDRILNPEHVAEMERRRNLRLDVGDIVEDDAGTLLVVTGIPRHEGSDNISCVAMAGEKRAFAPMTRVLIKDVVEKGAFTRHEATGMVAHSFEYSYDIVSGRIIPWKEYVHDAAERAETHDAADATPADVGLDRGEPPKTDPPAWVWCLVGNVIGEHPHGEDRRIVSGTRHFSAGTKVYCLPVRWGDGYEKIDVIGRPRGRRGLRHVVMRRSLVENFRIQKVFSPAVIEKMYEPSRPDFDGPSYLSWGNSQEDRETIEDMLRWLSPNEQQVRRSNTVADCRALRLEMMLLNDEVSRRRVVIERVRAPQGHDGYVWQAWLETSFLLQPLEVGAIGQKLEPQGYGGHADIERSLPDSLLDLRLHLWDGHYEAESSPKKPDFSWRLDVGEGEKAFSSSGTNAYPDEFPQLMRLLEASGFPRMWDQEAGCPLSPTPAQRRVAGHVAACRDVLESDELRAEVIRRLLRVDSSEVELSAAHKLLSLVEERTELREKLTDEEIAAIAAAMR